MQATVVTSAAVVLSAVLGTAAVGEVSLPIPPYLPVPQIVLAPTPPQAKVGDLVRIEGFALSVDPALRIDPSPDAKTFHVQIAVVQAPKAGKGKGRKVMLFEEIDNHEFVPIDIPIRTSGWSAGTLKIHITATADTIMGPVTTEKDMEIPVVKGNGTPK